MIMLRYVDMCACTPSYFQHYQPIRICILHDFSFYRFFCFGVYQLLQEPFFAAKNALGAFFPLDGFARVVPYRGRQHGGCQPRFWSQWPVLDILETHLPWQQRVIQLATVQGHEQETLVKFWGGRGVDLGERMRCEKMC